MWLRRHVKRQIEVLSERRGGDARGGDGRAERQCLVLLSRGFTNSDAELGAKVSQTDFCGFFVVFLRAVERPHSGGGRCLTDHDLLGASNRDQSHEDSARGANRGCGDTFYFSGESENLVAESSAVAVEFLGLSKEEAYAKNEDTSAEVLFEGDSVPRSGREVRQRQTDHLAG